jgi:excisionase family DNA binding protein
METLHMTGNRKWMTPAEVAEMHGIHRTTVYRRIYAGELPAHRVGLKYQIARKDAAALCVAVDPRSVSA